MNYTMKAVLIAALVALTSACAQGPNEQQTAAATTNQVETLNESGNLATVPVDETKPFEPEPATESQYVDERDPFESFNRSMWDFNWEVLDKHILRPLAVGYTSLPQPVQQGTRSFVTNLEEPGYALNSLVQLKFKKAATGVGRFVINSTIGLLGIFDVADAMGLKRHKEDFGQTLAMVGVGNGPFIMLPGYGPTTVRDGVGDFVDSEIFPMYLIEWPWSLVKTGLKAVYSRADMLQQERLIYDSTDPYIFVKEAYFQNQNYQIFDGNPPVKEEFKLDDEFLDEID
ncbi:VacJ family lipoprotein [Psychrosphaera ytuae]|uniref:VacJ family lipoprotein n=1 Tax=Psychrosphaera ytuae TaxID=2820710 RepID=A0A975DCJ1_9GAMM|nr:VacJ family lipoprotein [Psychrosphaera ytuae]QTH64596.1 VacJ family lipoprotein [Psychrosphaera ytuae]